MPNGSDAGLVYKEVKRSVILLFSSALLAPPHRLLQVSDPIRSDPVQSYEYTPVHLWCCTAHVPKVTQRKQAAIRRLVRFLSVLQYKRGMMSGVGISIRSFRSKFKFAFLSRLPMACIQMKMSRVVAYYIMCCACWPWCGTTGPWA